MSFQTYITEQVAAISAKLNAIATNAKKIDELPAQEYLDPTSRIHVSRDGISERITVGQIIDAIENSNFDEIISVGAVTIVYNEISGINEAIVPIIPIPTWRINDVYYTKSTETAREVPFAATGLNRFDILIMNTSNDIVIERGDETAGIAVIPTKPLNTIILSSIYVTDSSVGDPTDPVDLSNYLDRGGYNGSAIDLVEKFESRDITINYGATLALDQINLTDVRSSVSLEGSATSVKSAQYDIQYVRPGKPHFFKNRTGHDVTIEHNSGTGNIKYFF
ncbi:hypothetical protein EV143_1211, partial [Flavobacterium chryseum]|uniref:hypothetical protein n=1 Tax=Flavobacterium sp. P3160 TaxID=2512113 RepID=UPI0010611AC4